MRLMNGQPLRWRCGRQIVTPNTATPDAAPQLEAPARPSCSLRIGPHQRTVLEQKAKESLKR
jgi:hypothetical protein